MGAAAIEKMSGDNDAETSSYCASCGKAEIDDIKLMPCDDCDLVRYCGDECREDYKSEHADDCTSRAAELRDELLFKQPESNHWGDCPICCLPLPIDISKSSMWTCCSKVICKGCIYANGIREIEARLQHTCPFCRESTNRTEEEMDKQMMKRIEMNDPAALRQEGAEKYSEGDYQSAFEYWSKAAELGDAQAHGKLAWLYDEGQGVEKDEGKQIHHFEEAAIGGHPIARRVLGCEEMIKGNAERAVKHWIIAATQGEDDSIKKLLEAFKKGYVEKEELAAALRAHKAAVDATKSPQREAANEFFRKNNTR